MTQQASASRSSAASSPGNRAKKDATVAKVTQKSDAAKRGVVPMDFERYVDDFFGNWQAMMKSFLDSAPALSASETARPSTPVSVDVWRAQADRYFADLRRHWADMARFAPISAFSPQSMPAVPPVFDLTQEDDAYHVSGAVPGMDAENVTLEIDGNLLVISGETSEASDQEKNGVSIHSACADCFSQRIFLPPDAIADKIEAKVEKGILTITMPRAGDFQSSKRKIAIKK
tara:strand:- start:101613 stop:102305 length:693 start_codon:yes stop_codon:yes gene_type:complete